eukprot:TRINITY_DN5406_c1_g2_i1.p1 TRINITY_DN5406_c1_g2~~TRINITY_DN5406_c1_g2_i1.p1  ORF type:complete len:908 (+),score=98.97 TRINITY_DN5406_c1_g2_i1:154-2877(+)
MPEASCLRDRAQDAAEKRYHLAFELWPISERWHREWQDTLPRRAPVALPDMGYNGRSGTWVGNSVTASALTAEGWSLDVYAYYDATRYEPWKFFSSILEMNTSRLASCTTAQTAIATQLPSVAEILKWFPHDADGYETTPQGKRLSRCLHGGWWLSPACRAHPERCVPWITYGAGYYATAFMQQSTYYQIPVAITTMAEDAPSTLRDNYRFLQYGWTPDINTPRDATFVTFPAYNDTEHQGGLTRTVTSQQELKKLVMKGLDDPTVSRALVVVERMRIPLEAMEGMLAELVAGKSHYAAACKWLQTASSWKAWIPSSTECVAGQGLANALGELVTSASNATTCVWCPTGTFSVPDASLKTFVCQPCPAGEFRSAVGATSCQRCQSGAFSGSAGQSVCDRCGSATYSDTQGASECRHCPTGLVTDGLGAGNLSDCVCPKGTFESPDKLQKGCMVCSWYRTTRKIGAVTEASCVLDGAEVVLHVAVVCAVLGLCAALSGWCRYTRNSEDETMRKVLKQGFAAISAPQHPMCLISLNCFLELAAEDVACCYEGARDEGQLLFLDSLESVVEFKKSGRKILFVSYNWLSWVRLGPSEEQLTCMQNAARTVCRKHEIDPESFFVWLDVLSIPQAHDNCKSLAVASLYVYASQSDFLVVVCPAAIHEDSGETIGLESVKSRLWCRVEQVAHCCNNGLQGMYVCAEKDELTLITEDWIRDVVRIFDGELTCCRQGHPDGGQCDRELLVPTALAMYADLLCQHHEETLRSDTLTTLWPMIRENRDLVFPKTFLYKRRGGQCSRRLLFGSMMDKVAELVSKPAFRRNTSLRTSGTSPRTFRLSQDATASSSTTVLTTLRQRLRLPPRRSRWSRFAHSFSDAQDAPHPQYSQAQLRRLARSTTFGSSSKGDFSVFDL